MIKWSIGGVPEHFNLPWVDLIARLGSDAPVGNVRGPIPALVAAEWRDYPGGTGAMVQALATRELDIAVLLTEGAVAGIGRGGDFSIVANYVVSPLIWGIHVPPASQLERLGQLAAARFAVSRMGSGSHLMALALANEQGWALADDQFVVVGSLAGAIDAFAAGQADVFLWEHFMTQPVVTAGKFRRIGDFVAPWSAFVTCANPEVLAHVAALEELVCGVGEEAARFASDPRTPQRIVARFGLNVREAGEWLSRTRFARGVERADGDVAAAAAMLRQAGVLAGGA